MFALRLPAADAEMASEMGSSPNGPITLLANVWVKIGGRLGTSGGD